MKKERKYTRKRTSDYFLVRHLQTNQIIGRMVNVSLGGLVLVANDPLPVHDVYHLKLVFPRVIADKGAITFSAESRWSKYNNHADWWEIGFEIREIELCDVVLLYKVIQQMTTDGGERRNDKESVKRKTVPKLEYIKPR